MLVFSDVFFLYSRTASTVAGVQIINATRKVAATREAAICRPIIYVCAAGSVGRDFFGGGVWVGKCMGSSSSDAEDVTQIV